MTITISCIFLLIVFAWLYYEVRNALYVDHLYNPITKEGMIKLTEKELSIAELYGSLTYDYSYNHKNQKWGYLILLKRPAQKPVLLTTSAACYHSKEVAIHKAKLYAYNLRMSYLKYYANATQNKTS